MIDFRNTGVIPSDKKLKGLTKLVDRMLQMQEEVADAESVLRIKTEQLKHISEIDIPALMDEIGLESVTLSSGRKVSVVRKLYASISAMNKEAAHAWLREHNHHGLIKSEVIAKFGKGESDKAESIVTVCKKKKIPVAVRESVHASTLKAFVREQLKEGNPIPLELFGVRDGSSTKII